ncbi:hypothetical protein Tco_0272050 [Tanacetum coccineum]
MSSSTVTYTSISFDSDLPPWGFHLMDPAEFESPPSLNYVLGPGHPPSPDYVPGPKEPEQAPLSPDYVLEPEYPEYLLPSDAKAPIEDQPLPDNASPTTLSPGYIADSDPEEDLEEDSCHYSCRVEMMDDEEEGIQLRQLFCILVDDLVPQLRLPLAFSRCDESATCLSSDDTEVFETDESASTPPVTSPRLCRARVSVRPQTPMSAAIEALIAAKRAHFTAPTGRFEVEESSSASAMQTRYTLAHRVDYGFIETMDASIQAAKSRAMTAIGEVNERVTNLTTTQRQETYELQAADARWAWDHSESRSQAIEAQIRALQRDVDVIQRFKELVRTAEVGPQDGPVDAGSSSDEVEKYVGGLPDMIQGSVMVSKPKKMQNAIEFGTELMDQKIRTLAERQAENKRKFEDTSRNNQN